MHRIYTYYFYSMRSKLVPAKKKTLNATLKKVLIDFGGPEAANIAKILAVADDETTDEQIAEMAKVKLNIVRKILYILSENKLARFRRVRDKRSGWFVFYWQESFDKLPDVLKDRRQMVIEKLEARIFNAPTNFDLPSTAMATGGLVSGAVINVYESNSPKETGEAVLAAIDNYYGEQADRSGSAGSIL